MVGKIRKMEFSKDWSAVSCFSSETVTTLMESALKDQGFIFRPRTENRFWTFCNEFDILSPVELNIKVCDYFLPGSSHDVSKISIKPVVEKTESHIKRVINVFVAKCPRKPWEFEKGTIKEKIDYLKRNRWKTQLLLFIPIILVVSAFFFAKEYLAVFIDAAGFTTLALLYPLFGMEEKRSEKVWRRWLNEEKHEKKPMKSDQPEG